MKCISDSTLPYWVCGSKNEETAGSIFVRLQSGLFPFSHPGVVQELTWNPARLHSLPRPPHSSISHGAPAQGLFRKLIFLNEKLKY